MIRIYIAQSEGYLDIFLYYSFFLRSGRDFWAIKNLSRATILCRTVVTTLFPQNQNHESLWFGTTGRVKVGKVFQTYETLFPNLGTLFPRVLPRSFRLLVNKNFKKINFIG